MAGVIQLLRVLQAAMTAGKSHHGCLGVVKGGTRAVQAVGTNGVFYHIKLFELKTKVQRKLLLPTVKKHSKNNLQSSSMGSRVEKDRQTNSSLGFVDQNTVYFHLTFQNTSLPNSECREMRGELMPK